MNFWLLAAGLLAALAFLAHLIAGTRECWLHRPQPGPAERAWVQSLCGWQMVSADLLVCAALLTWLGVAGGPWTRAGALFAGAWLGAQGLAWLLTLIGLRRPGADYLALPQFALLWLMAGLALVGALLA